VDSPPAELPVRLVVRDAALERTRLTVFFRLFLAIPVLVWLILWGIAAFVAAIILWFAILFRGTAPEGLHGFIAGYLRYWSHVTSYLLLAADPYPWFRSTEEYPIDLEIDPPARQNRWASGFRIFLALPALVLAATLGGTPGEGGWQVGARDTSGHGSEWRVWGGLGGVAAACAFLTWFAALVRGRSPRGLRDLTAYSLGYAAQATGYVLLLTDRYPRADPALAEPYAALPPHPVRMVVNDPLERSRLTVFFRLLLAIPHFVWLALWSIVAFFAAVVAWFVALVTGRVPVSLHRFLAAFVRYAVHVGAYVSVVGSRFPGFAGREGSYGIDVELDPPEPQSRWVTLFRLVLAIPALIVGGALSGALFVAAFLGWWYALVIGREPEGLRNLGAACLRYSAQAYAYLFLLTPQYPFASPVLEERASPEPPPEAAPAGASY
jgi:hypothetical protein